MGLMPRGRIWFPEEKTRKICPRGIKSISGQWSAAWRGEFVIYPTISGVFPRLFTVYREIFLHYIPPP